jgi:hypothetical protein
MSQTPLHDWLRPRLDRLLAEAGNAGFEREAVLAVLTDLATSPGYVYLPPPAETEMRGPWPEETEAGTIHPV